MFTVRYVDMASASIFEHPVAGADLRRAQSVARELSRDYHGASFVLYGGRVVATFEHGRLVGVSR